MVETIFSNPWFTDLILPFLLVFTLIFAILEKSKLLGDDRKQINAIVSLVIGLVFIAFPFARGVVIKLIPFLAVSVVILFVFMLIMGFILGTKEGDVLNKGLKIALGIIFGLAVLVAVLWFTGGWDLIYNFVTEQGWAESILINLFILAIIGGAIAVVLSSGGKSSS
jgi:hypothetical protein